MVMLLNDIFAIKQLVFQAWKERWTEDRWSCQVRKLIASPPDSLQLADALVSQAFVGSTPNSLLVRNILVCLKNSLITYASVINTISKHDDLIKVESTKSMYKLLHEMVRTINIPGGRQLAEDSMLLCGSLRVILQWLLRNAERFFEEHQDCLTDMSCAIIDELTTRPRTSALLTIARFEESGPWSHIETDLAVIKNSANGSPFSAKINATCNHVSQVSRRTIDQSPVYVDISNGRPICPPILMLLMLEVERHKLSDHHFLVHQLLVLGRICGLDTSALLFSIFHSCLLCFIDSTGQPTEKNWMCMIFSKLPSITAACNVALEKEIASSGSSSSRTSFQQSLYYALCKLIKYESLLDSVDQLRSDLDFIQTFTLELNRIRLLNEEACKKIQDQRNLHRVLMGPNDGVDHCISPNLALKANNTVTEVIRILDNCNHGGDLEQLLPAFQTIFSPDSLDMIVAAAAASGSLKAFASSLLRFNDAAKVSVNSVETSKQARTRAALFDTTFLILVHLVKTFGISAVLATEPNSGLTNNTVNYFLAAWLQRWWPCESIDEVIDTSSTSDYTSNLVEGLMLVLRNGNEFKLTVTKWNGICMNLPQALIEMLYAKQKGYISNEELEKACILMRSHFPFSCILTTITALSRTMTHSVLHNVYTKVFQILMEKSSSTDSSYMIPLYQSRYTIFIKLANHITSNLLNDNFVDVNESLVKIFDETFAASMSDGWVSVRRLNIFTDCLRRLGARCFVTRACQKILDEVGLSQTRLATDIVFSLVSIDPATMIAHLLRYFVPQQIKSAPQKLVEPSGGCLAKLLVASLDFAVNDSQMRSKMTSSTQIKNELSPFVFDPNNLSNTRLRRMLSCSTEHDLAPSGARLPPNEPLATILNDFIQLLSNSLCSNAGSGRGPHVDFAFTFVRLALQSSILLSGTIKELMPAGLLRLIGTRLADEDLRLLFAASDLGDATIRRISADAVLFSKTSST